MHGVHTSVVWSEMNVMKIKYSKTFINQFNYCFKSIVPDFEEILEIWHILGESFWTYLYIKV